MHIAFTQHFVKVLSLLTYTRLRFPIAHIPLLHRTILQEKHHSNRRSSHYIAELTRYKLYGHNSSITMKSITENLANTERTLEATRKEKEAVAIEITA